jgi:hypothetical protein
VAASAPASPRLFDSTILEAGIHRGVPLGALRRSFEDAVGYRFGLSTTYWERIHATGFLQYAAADGTIPVHYLVAAAGFDVGWTRQFSSAILLSLHYARTREEHSPPLQLDGGESEFGLEARLGFEPGLRWPVSPRLRSEFSMAFTAPHPSLWIWTGIDFAWRVP